MNSNVLDYINALQRQFAVPRKLTDGTLVTGFVPDEELAITQFIGAFSRQRRGGGRLTAFVEFSPEANPYKTIMLGWWGLLGADADATDKALLWVTTTGAMKAKAEMHAISLGLLQPIKYTTWGDLAKLARHNPTLLHQVIIVGDVDFEPGNNVHRLLSGDGSIGHDEVLAAVRQMASDSKLDLVLFRRAGWVPAFDPSAMLAGDSPAEVKEPKSGGCFIATACCGSPADPFVQDLRRFRDEVLVARAPGRLLAAAYARFSPPLADWIGGRAWARTLIRHMVVRPLAWAVRTRGAGRPRGQNPLSW